MFKTALHPAGEGVHGVPGAIAQPHQVQHGGDAFLEGCSPQAVDAAEEGQVVPGAEGGIEGQLLGDEADERSDPIRFSPQIISADENLPFVRGEQGGQDGDQRRLSGPVRPQQAEDLSFPDGEAHPVEGHSVAVSLDQPLSFDHRIGCSLLHEEITLRSDDIHGPRMIGTFRPY
jgi:hypothetical protein